MLLKSIHAISGGAIPCSRRVVQATICEERLSTCGLQEANFYTRRKAKEEVWNSRDADGLQRSASARAGRVAAPFISVDAEDQDFGLSLSLRLASTMDDI